jgi:hypothetical protein
MHPQVTINLFHFRSPKTKNPAQGGVLNKAIKLISTGSWATPPKHERRPMIGAPIGANRGAGHEFQSFRLAEHGVWH